MAAKAETVSQADSEARGNARGLRRGERSRQCQKDSDGAGHGGFVTSPGDHPDPFTNFKTSRGIIRLAVMLYVRFPLSLRNVEDLLHERGIDASHEAVRYWWHRFGPFFAAEIRKRWIEGMKSSRWRWHLDEMFVKINGERHYLWRAMDHGGERG